MLTTTKVIAAIIIVHVIVWLMSVPQPFIRCKMRQRSVFAHHFTPKKDSALSVRAAKKPNIKYLVNCLSPSIPEASGGKELCLGHLKNLIQPQALCLAHSFLSFYPHCQIGYCSSFEMQKLVNIWLSGGKNTFLDVGGSLKSDWFLRIIFQFLRNFMTAFFPFSSCVEQIFIKDILW